MCTAGKSEIIYWGRIQGIFSSLGIMCVSEHEILLEKFQWMLTMESPPPPPHTHTRQRHNMPYGLGHTDWKMVCRDSDRVWIGTRGRLGL